MAVKVELNGEITLLIADKDSVVVPLCPNERAQCRKQLLDALKLLDQTIVKWTTFSTGAEMDAVELQSSLHPDDCLAVFDCSPPSKL